MKEAKNGSVINEMVKYGVVGAVSTAIDMGILNISSRLLNDNMLWLSVGIGFAAGTINGYYMNSRWTFRYNTEGQEGKKFTQFAIVSLIGLLLTELIVNYFTKSVGFDKNISKLIAVAIVFFWNYGANKVWTFKKQERIANSTNG